MDSMNLKSTVDHLNQLQIVASKAKLTNIIKLPQLVTVGAQSTGKSTLLDAIVGIHFLPRGDGIVTRTPVVLQLSNIAGDDEKAPREEFRVNDVICHSWKEVTSEIVNETKKIAGERDVSETPIYVTIKSPIVPNLSLVDLPGLTKNVIEGQSKDVVTKINNMVRKYIENENTIILAVSDAGVDVANSDSLQLAKEVDPDGLRTLGILTKMDRLEGNKNLGFLTGDLLERKLKLGYIGVKCQKIEEKLSLTMEEERTIEDAWFNEDVKFQKVRNALGVKNLIVLLEQIFSRHLRSTIPKIQERIRTKIQEREQEMAAFGMEFNSPEERSRFIVASIKNVYENFMQEFNSQGDDSNQINGEIILQGAIKIKSIIDKSFMKAVDEFDPFMNLSNETIRTAIIKSESYLPSMFFKEEVFLGLIKKQIAKLQVPSLQCLSLIKKELEILIDDLKIREAEFYINLKIEIKKKMRDYLDSLYEDTKKIIITHMKSHTEIIDTENPYFRVVYEEVIKESVSNDEVEYEEVKSHRPSAKSEESNKKKDPAAYKVFKETGKKKTMSQNSSQIRVEDDDECSIKVEKHELDKDNIEVKLKQPQSVLILSPDLTKKEEEDLENTKRLISCYANIVQKDLITNIPRYIRCFLVKSFIDNCHQELTNNLLVQSPEFIHNYLLETDKTMKVKKDYIISELKGLKDCEHLISKVSERLKK